MDSRFRGNDKLFTLPSEIGNTPHQFESHPSKNAGDMLEALARTANECDYAAHMDLISPTVNVFGVSGFEVIGHDDWARQCEHEFEQGLLRSVSYEGL